MHMPWVQIPTLPKSTEGVRKGETRQAFMIQCNLSLSEASLETLGRPTDLDKTEQGKNCIIFLKAHLFFVTYKFIPHIWWLNYSCTKYIIASRDNDLGHRFRSQKVKSASRPCHLTDACTWPSYLIFCTSVISSEKWEYYYLLLRINVMILIRHMKSIESYMFIIINTASF
jgi:hypothetical protein